MTQNSGRTIILRLFIYQEMPLKPEQRHKTMQRLMGMEALKAFRMWEESADKTEY